MFDNKIREVNAGERYSKDAIVSMIDQLGNQRVYKKEKKVKKGPNYIEPIFRQAAKGYCICNERGKTIKRFWTLGERSAWLFRWDYQVPEEIIENNNVDDEIGDVEY